MHILEKKISYHKAASEFLKSYYEENSAENIFFSYGFLKEIAKEARKIAKSLGLKDMEFQNSIIAAWFSFSGVADLCSETAIKSGKLLNQFFIQVNYPESEQSTINKAITTYVENRYAETKIEKVVCDSINSRLAKGNFVENIILLKEESNRINKTEMNELFFLKYYQDLFLKRKYYTGYANQNYTEQRERNFELLGKRIHKMETAEDNLSSEHHKANNTPTLNNKETEDFFKIAFRNYNHLVSVADSKSSLLIHVNSIIISVMLAFVLGRIGQNRSLLYPAILLLTVNFITILLSILASRPQKDRFREDKHAVSSQKFFFGSFDLVDPGFRKTNWEQYCLQLNELFNNAKQNVYMEVYRESYNVRKVLSKKFSYLSMAYSVFIIGLLLSVIAFVIAVESQIIGG